MRRTVVAEENVVVERDRSDGLHLGLADVELRDGGELNVDGIKLGVEAHTQLAVAVAKGQHRARCRQQVVFHLGQPLPLARRRAEPEQRQGASEGHAHLEERKPVLVRRLLHRRDGKQMDPCLPLLRRATTTLVAGRTRTRKEGKGVVPLARSTA